MFLDDRAKVAETLPREVNNVENAHVAIVLKTGESLDQAPFGLFLKAGMVDNRKPAHEYLPGGKVPDGTVVKNNIIYFPSVLTLEGDGGESTELGTLVLGLSRDQMIKAQRSTLVSATASSLFIAVLLVALCFVFTRRAFAPLRAAVNAIQVMARGDLRRPCLRRAPTKSAS